MSGIPSKVYFTEMTAWSKRHKKVILVLVILGSKCCCEQPGYFSNTLVAHKAPTVHGVGNWDKKISQDFPDWMPNPLWTVWNAQIMLIPYHQEKQQMLYNCFTHVARTLHPLGKLCILLESKLFSSYFSRFYLILVNLFPLCWWPVLCQLPAGWCSLVQPSVCSPFRPSVPIIPSLIFDDSVFLSSFSFLQD